MYAGSAHNHTHVVMAHSHTLDHTHNIQPTTNYAWMKPRKDKWRCSYCGSINDYADNNCSQCGAIGSQLDEV